jgi:SAM-dependent methyltransferase
VTSALSLRVFKDPRLAVVDRYREANKQLWEEWAAIHPSTEFYRVEDFKRGWDPLRPFEVEELGDVAELTLLHLQCHFGRDTLAWARRGARVTGADFSETAIGTARELAAELGLEARFVQSDLYDLPRQLVGRFDIVYTSFGAIYWLPDIERWAEVVDHFLAPGGRFYIAEFHPITHVFDDSEGATEPRVRYPYFHHSEPIAWPVEGSYADRQAAVESRVQYGWDHSLGEVVSAIAGRGLHIEFLHELPSTLVQWAPFLEKREDGDWWLHGPGELPMIFTMLATKPA